MYDFNLTAEAEECRRLAVALASAFDGLHGPKANSKPTEESTMTAMSEFIARENIRRFKAQLLTAEEGTRREAMLQRLLKDEEDHLSYLLAEKD
jgi:hypothetical protein